MVTIWSFVRLISPDVTTTSITLSSNKIQNGETFWYQPTLSIWKKAVTMERFISLQSNKQILTAVLVF